MTENKNGLIATVLGENDFSDNYMGEELRFLYEADDQEYELYYYRDKVTELEFIHMIKYFIGIENIFMLIRFVYKHSNYLLKDCLINENEYNFKTDKAKREKLLKRVDQLYNADYPLE